MLEKSLLSISRQDYRPVEAVIITCGPDGPVRPGSVRPGSDGAFAAVPLITASIADGDASALSVEGIRRSGGRFVCILDEGEELHAQLDALTGTSEAVLKRDAAIENLNRKLREKDERISILRTDHFLVTESLGWQILEGFRRFLQPLFPRGSKRRESFVRAKKYLKYLVRHGAVRNFAKKLLRLNKTPDAAYRDWIARNEPDAAAILRQSEEARRWQAQGASGTDAKNPQMPAISIVAVLYGPGDALPESVISQSCCRWEFCAADASDDGFFASSDFFKADERIKIVRVEKSAGICDALNRALALAKKGLKDRPDREGPDGTRIRDGFIVLLRNTDTLAPFALFEAARAINENPGCDFLYCDTDVLARDGKIRRSPAFKPDWSPDALRSADYVSDFMIIGRALLEECGGFQAGLGAGCGEAFIKYDLALRATERARRIVHIPKVLCHVGEAGTSYNANKTEGAMKALEAHLKRLGRDGAVRAVSHGVFKVTYRLTRNPLISIVIPNRNSAKELRVCLESVYEKSSYKNFEVVVVENGSDEEDIFRLYREYEKARGLKVARWAGPFNYSDVNNYGVSRCSGDVLLFLNNDTEAINPDWLERMLEHALRPEVGAVGAKLYYPNDTVQHAGVVVGLGGIAGHSHKGFKRTSAGYTNRLWMVQNYSAVTAACVMMRRNVFQEAGGFDPGYSLAYNDVDLCMKLVRRGYLIVWTPWAELYHYESMTRGIADTPDKLRHFFAEMQLFRARWSEYVKKGDPFYSPNLTLHREDFSIKTYADDDPGDASASSYLFD
jgi:GT2 family glycosyltransferase